MNSFVAMARTDLESAQEAQEFFSQALGMAFDCIEATAADVDLGWILNQVVQPIVWVISGVKTAVAGIVAAADLGFDMDGYQIHIRHKIARKVTANSVGNLLIPAGTCGTVGGSGWDQRYPIQLRDGKGERFDASDRGAGILSTRLVGTVDLTADGAKDAVLLLQCTGSREKMCCAGRLSIMNVVAVLDLNGASPRRLGTPIFAQSVLDSDGEQQPRAIQSDSVRIDGKRIVTLERLVYPEQLDPAEAARLDGRMRYALANGRWTPTKI